MSKILVVDDEVEIRDLCYDLFSSDGHEVITAPTGTQALVLLETKKPDLVLMDVHIPGEHGLSLLRKMRACQRNLPVIVFSAYVTVELEKQAYEAGAVEVLRKGQNTEELRKKINQVLANVERIFGDRTQKKEKILIADDDAMIRGLLREFFKLKGYETVEATTGEEAVEAVRIHNPSAVLLDVIMPVMDGLTALKKIREINPKIGVVMATGVRDEEMINKAMALGAYGCVLKPFDLKYLELVVLTRLLIAS